MSQTVLPFSSLDQSRQYILDRGQQLILLAGASASGKSFIAEKLADSLRESGSSVMIISSDDYYSDQTNLQYVLYGTFDHPHLIQYEKLGDDIDTFLTTGEFQRPNYSFVEKRSTHTTSVSGTYDYVIVEGLYTIDQLGERFADATKVFVESSYEEIIFRRIVRDQKRVRESNHMMINNIGKAFPMRNIFGEHQYDDADLIITNGYEILDHQGIESKYIPYEGDLASLGEPSAIEEREHFVYSNTDNNESDIIITETYRDHSPLLTYIMISAVRPTDDVSDHHIDVILYDPGALTDMHTLLQTAGLDIIDRFQTTKYYYGVDDEKQVLLEKREQLFHKIV